MKRVALIGLVKIELPAVTVLLCDGGFIVWGSDTYKSKHATFGTIGGIQRMSEGLADQVPALEMTLLPPADASIADLAQPGYQKSRVRFWLGEYDVAAGALIGTPDLLFDGQIDQTILNLDRSLAITVVSKAERLFELNIGNSLNPSFHKSVWPGETGHDNATGLGKPIAWGVEAPPVAYIAPSVAAASNGAYNVGISYAF